MLLVKTKSSFHPPRNRNACLDKAIDFLQQQTFQTSWQTTDFLQQQTFQTSCTNKSKFTKSEWKDLLVLNNNSKSVIKEADKGGCVVLMNKPYYKKMVFQHLNDTKTYQKTDQKCDNRVMKKIVNWQTNMSHS